MSSTASSARKRPRSGHALFSLRFIVVAVLLMVAARYMRPALGVFERHFSKEPIALNKSLDDFDASRLETFRPVPGKSTLGLSPGDLETEDFIAPVFEPLTGGAEAKKRNQAMLFVSYYSDPRERISHTSEVCYRQSGAVVERIVIIPVVIPALGQTIEARLLDINQHGDRKALLYVLVCNGKVYHDRETVRFVIGWPGDKYTYFSKVEATKRIHSDQTWEETVELLKNLMRESLPILMEDHYPTREQVKR